MRLKTFSKLFLTFLFGIIIVGCTSKNNDTSKTGHTKPVNTASRTMQEELDFMKTKAQALVKNDKGYWEADFGNGIVLIYVPEGSFTMGNNELRGSSPEHQVNLSHYWIAKNMVTTGQFREFVNETNFVTDTEKPGAEGCYVYDFSIEAFRPKTGYDWDNAYDDILEKFPEITLTDEHPVSCVSWYDAITYTDWLSKKTGVDFTLPTYAEYEYAARGTDGRIYPWGNEVSDGTRANYADESMNKYFPNLEQALVHFGIDDGFVLTSPVGSFPNGASPVGALDMVGNLNQWTFDSYFEYTPSTKDNPIYLGNSADQGMDEADLRMEKSGDWSSSAGRVGQTPDEIEFGHNIRADGYSADPANSSDDHLGFRIGISYTARN